jgi:ABC-2 type transport system permease protein
MIAQLRSELRKMRSTRTNLGLLLGLLGIVLLTVLAGGLSMESWALDRRDDQLDVLRNGTNASIFAALIGVLAMTSEFRHGTIRSTFVFTPARGRVVLAKVTAGLLVGAGFGALGEAFAIGLGVLVLRVRGASLEIGAADVRQLFLGAIGLCALWAALGVGLGAVVRNQVFAIVGLSVWAFVVEMILLAYAPGVARYGPGPAGRAMTGDTNGADSLHLLSAPAGALLLALYAGLFAAAGVAVTRRRDV